MSERKQLKAELEALGYTLAFTRNRYMRFSHPSELEQTVEHGRRGGMYRRNCLPEAIKTVARQHNCLPIYGQPVYVRGLPHPFLCLEAARDPAGGHRLVVRWQDATH